MTRGEAAFDPRTDRPGAARIADMLRVDQAGEYGAVEIYRGQRAVFAGLPHKRRIAAILDDMAKSEAAHLAAFDRLLAERRVRPTLLSPIWKAAGFALGAATALIGEKAAMAATEAVEDVIEAHYQRQARALEARDPPLAAALSAFGAEEAAHRRTAEAEGAREAVGHPFLRGLIQAGCRAAIRLSEKI
ncbi:MAG: demethoxyubiquinone hydroxylase family protein [Amphiplicatus sp.]